MKRRDPTAHRLSAISQSNGIPSYTAERTFRTLILLFYVCACLIRISIRARLWLLAPLLPPGHTEFDSTAAHQHRYLYATVRCQSGVPHTHQQTSAEIHSTKSGDNPTDCSFQIFVLRRQKDAIAPATLTHEGYSTIQFTVPYANGTEFTPRIEDPLLRGTFVVFLSPPRQLKSAQGPVLPHPFQFIIHSTWSN